MDPIWAKYAYLLDEVSEYRVRLKPEVVAACKAKEFKPWKLSDAEALLQKLFKARKMPDDFSDIFGYVDDYLTDDPTLIENLYEISDPTAMAQCMNEEEKQLSKERQCDKWRFSLQSNAEGIISGFYCPLIYSRDVMGYIFLFNGFNLEGNNFKSYTELGYIDFLARKGFIEI